MTNEILFIAHDAGYTGAPIILLHFLRWLKEHTDISFSILLRNPGPLENSYRQVAPVFTLGKNVYGFLNRRLPKESASTLRYRIIDGMLRKHYSNRKIGLIYANTATNGEILKSLSFLSCPVITHVHELENWIRNWIDPKDFSLTIQETDVYIAVSQAVQRNLVGNHGISPDLIQLVYEFIDVQTHLKLSKNIDLIRIRHQIGVPDDALIVGGCGSADWRKGADLFIELVKRIPEQIEGKPVHGVWVGANLKGSEHYQLREAIRIENLNDRVHFTGIQANPVPFLACFDVFALTSREDPFPLVMLESAALGKPIVCFDGSGGAPEFIAAGCGFAVPYLDTEAMAAKVLKLLADESLRQYFGLYAKAKVIQSHDVSVGAPKLFEIIQQYFSN